MLQHTFAVKLEQLAKFEDQMDHEILATFIWQVENYMALTGTTDALQQACFASILLTNSAAIWLCH